MHSWLTALSALCPSRKHLGKTCQLWIYFPNMRTQRSGTWTKIYFKILQMLTRFCFPALCFEWPCSSPRFKSLKPLPNSRQNADTVQLTTKRLWWLYSKMKYRCMIWRHGFPCFLFPLHDFRRGEEGKKLSNCNTTYCVEKCTEDWALPQC